LQERHNKREMYLHLLLIISPAFGMPSSDLIGTGKEIIKQFDSLPDFTKETKAMFKNITRELYEKVSESLLEAEKNILELNVELKLLETENVTFQDEYFPAFNKAKRYLRESRQKLRKLADRTVKEVIGLKVLLTALDESEDMFLLKTSLDKMKDLMIETLDTLKEALEKYNSAQETFQNLNSSIKGKNIRLEKMVTNNTAEYNDWVTKARLGTYGGLTTATVGFIIADIFGCLGICSAVNVAVIVPSVTAATETKIQEYTEMLEKFKMITEKMMKNGEDFDRTIKDAMFILSDEIELINNWTNSAEVVNKNIDKYPKEYLKKYISIRTIFVNGLDDLKNSAEDFLARPVEIL